MMAWLCAICLASGCQTLCEGMTSLVRPHCPVACKGIEWLNSTWSVHSNWKREVLSPTEYLNIQGGREQQQEKGDYNVRSRDGRNKTAGNRLQKGLLHSLSLCKKHCLPRMIGEPPNSKRHGNSLTNFVLPN